MTDDSVRQPRKFEPPPWERDRFDELARKRAEEEAAAAQLAADAAAAAAAAPVAPAPEVAATVAPVAPAPAAPAEVAPAPQAEAPVVMQPAPQPVAAQAPQPAAPAARAAAVVDPEVEMMLAGLRSEEPRVFERVWIAWLVASAMFAAVGVFALYLGLAGVIRSNGSAGATMWSAMSDISGLAALACAIWMLVKALRERGA